MTHPLDGARLKISRAQEHLDSLKAEIGRYIDERPYTFAVEEAHPDVDVVYPNPRVTTQPALRFGTLVGDCVTNLRSALDYVMWELASKFFEPPIDLAKINDRRITAFPIANVSTDQGHNDRLDRLAHRKVPATAIREIKAVQPYSSGNPALWWLHGLVNADKHRMPLLAAAFIPSAVFIYPVDRDTPEVVFPDGMRQRNTVVQMDGRDVHMQYNLSIEVTLQDRSMPRGPVDRTLEQIITTVAEVIPRFDPFF